MLELRPLSNCWHGVPNVLDSKFVERRLTQERRETHLPRARLQLETARRLVQRGEHRAALRAIDAAALAGKTLTREGRLLRGRALSGLGDYVGALTAFESLCRLGRPQPRIDRERGLILFRLGRLPEARRALESGLRGGPQRAAEAHHVLGLICELEQRPGASWHFRRARKLAPARYSAVPRLSAMEFELALRSALRKASPGVLDRARRLPIVVTPAPSAQDFGREASFNPSQLGRLVWAAIESREPQQLLILYRRNIELAASQERKSIEQVLLAFTERALGEKVGRPHKTTLTACPPHRL